MPAAESAGATARRGQRCWPQCKASGQEEAESSLTLLLRLVMRACSAVTSTPSCYGAVHGSHHAVLCYTLLTHRVAHSLGRLKHL